MSFHCAHVTSDFTISFSTAEWYKPPREYMAQLITKREVPVINRNILQPAPDSSALCTVMAPVSPHQELNWLKIPCEYDFKEMKRVNVICKMKAGDPGTTHFISAQSLLHRGIFLSLLIMNITISNHKPLFDREYLYPKQRIL